MHPKMMERNAKVFLSKRKLPDKGQEWLKAHMRVRFSKEEADQLVEQLRSM